MIDSTVKDIKSRDLGNTLQREEQVVKGRERKHTKNIQANLHLNLHGRRSRESRVDNDLKVFEVGHQGL